MLSKRGVALLMLLCVIPISTAVDATLIASGLFELGNHLFRQDDLDRADQLYDIATGYDSDHCPAYYNRGVVAYEQEAFTAAESHFRQAIECDADYARAHYSLGLLLFEQGDFQVAAEHFQSTVELQPGNQNAHFDLGVALVELYRNGESDLSLISKALHHFQQAPAIEFSEQNIQVMQRLLS